LSAASGELVERLAATGRAILDSNWPCFHTRLYRWAVGGAEYGVVGGTVGAPFSVLVAEELFASGCEALVSISSAGLVAPDIVPPFFVLIERALRDEGTSHHYLPPERWAEADLRLIKGVSRSIPVAAGRVLRGASWTTDAPFRETEALIASRPWDSGLPVYVCRDPLGTMAELWPELRRFGTWSYATHASDERPRSGRARSD
jgi:uridine phosphorylase